MPELRVNRHIFDMHTLVSIPKDHFTLFTLFDHFDSLLVTIIMPLTLHSSACNYHFRVILFPLYERFAEDIIHSEAPPQQIEPHFELSIFA